MAFTFDLCGDHLALDFVNTLTDRGRAPVDRLDSYDALLAFARQTGIVARSRAAELRARAQQSAPAAADVRDLAVALREALYGIFSAVARGRAPALQDRGLLNRGMHRLCLDEDLSLTWRAAPDALDDFLGAVVLAAVELAASPNERKRVRICEAPDCEWLFYDTSRNRSRRWCDMRQCGNRMKARRHYARGRVGGDDSRS